MAFHQLHRRSLTSDHVWLCHLRYLGRAVCPPAARHRPAGEPLGAGSAFLDGGGRELHLCDLALRRWHRAGPRLEAWVAVHPVRRRYEPLLRVARRGRRAHVREPSRLRLERLGHDAAPTCPERSDRRGGASRAGRGMRKLWAIAGGSTLVYIVLALMMGVFPGLELSKTAPGTGVKPLTQLQAEGRSVYAANGCGYCHTQQVRPLRQDKVFGRPSAPGDFTYQTPELLGSERTGPDLTDVGTRRGSDVWQYMHLYNPRSVVPESIMPSFSWMFRVVDRAPPGVNPVPIPAGFAPAYGVVIPTHKTQALVAYLLSLKQPPLGGPESAGGKGSATASTGEAAAAPTARAAPSAGSAGHAAEGKPSTQSALPSAAQITHGEAVFTANCAACHQASGEGLPGAFPP